jgi:cell division protein FtsW (lipid II flippase)
MNKAIQSNLLRIAAAFILLQSIIITLSPVVRERTWDAGVVWSQWIAFVLWCALVLRVHREITQRLPDADPYLFPAAALLTGWGMLTIWRLEDGFGARQALWIGVSMIVFMAGMRLSSLQFLRRYKYMLLTGGLLLTALTLLFGTNPSGFGPRLWLGCCNIYFQPSEPLKLLLIIYLAAYFADKLPYQLRTIHILYPTLILGGIVILLLLAQRDLGTASIFIALYTIIIYLATERRRIILISVLSLVLVSVAGYYLVDIIQSRIDSWLNPWNDPRGASYQVIQSLIAIANGGIEGRGPGLGNPGLVPVAISDFIYTAIAEETGLFGTVGLLALFGIIITRGFRAALRAHDLFGRFLAAGISSYFGVQTILIVGGNLRLLPLTGVTLPFVSYGGSSLLTSFIALLILLFVSNHLDEEPAPLPRPAPYIALNAVLLIGLFISALGNGWWAVARGPDLLTRSDNPRRMIEERYVERGSILDRANTVITSNEGKTGTFTRTYKYPALAPITGYIHPVYGQSGLEVTLDEYLRGISGNSESSILLNQLLYGMSPSGLDVRLSIDLPLQSRADEMMLGHSGAVVLLNAQSGEILAISSSPTFDPNHLGEIGAQLATDPGKPLINRPAFGLYPTGSVMEPFTRAMYEDSILNLDQLSNAYATFDFFRAPLLRMAVAPAAGGDVKNMHATPLQMALACAALSNHGVIPAPRLAMAVNTPRDGWVVLPALGSPIEAIQSSAVDETVISYIRNGNNYWSHIGRAQDENISVTWFIGGTPPSWQAAPLVIVVLLEENNASLANQIGQELLTDAMNP